MAMQDGEKSTNRMFWIVVTGLNGTVDSITSLHLF